MISPLARLDAFAHASSLRALLLVPAFCLLGLGLARADAQPCEGRKLDAPGIMHAPICAPEKPARIVVLDPTFSLGMALELDLPVIGAPLSVMSDRGLHDKALARNVTDLGSFFEPRLEEIVALKPDLIIGSAMAGAAYPLLSRLAPTVLITEENWKSYMRLLAQVTGSEARADTLLTGYEARVAALRARIPATPVSVVRITPWDFQVYLDSPRAYGPFEVLRDLGVKRTAYETATGEETLKRPDWEELARLDGEVLLYIVGGSNNSATSGRHEEVLANPLWQMLPAVKAGHVHRVDPATWMEFSGLTSAERVLDDVERHVIPPP